MATKKVCVNSGSEDLDKKIEQWLQWDKVRVKTFVISWFLSVCFTTVACCVIKIRKFYYVLFLSLAYGLCCLLFNYKQTATSSANKSLSPKRKMRLNLKKT